jgi:hypothetical protein
MHGIVGCDAARLKDATARTIRDAGDDEVAERCLTDKDKSARRDQRLQIAACVAPQVDPGRRCGGTNHRATEDQSKSSHQTRSGCLNKIPRSSFRATAEPMLRDAGHEQMTSFCVKGQARRGQRTPRRIARRLGVARAAVYRVLGKAGHHVVKHNERRVATELEQRRLTGATTARQADAPLPVLPYQRLASHLVRHRITYLFRRALSDLFLGPYSA